jgi:hypothetical protein
LYVVYRRTKQFKHKSGVRVKKFGAWVVEPSLTRRGKPVRYADGLGNEAV